MKTILCVFGTRPEAIKLCPLIEELRKHPAECAVNICVTAQHRTLLDQVLRAFDITPDDDLHIMQPGQTLFYSTATILHRMDQVLQRECPDWVVVQGDTTTVFATALAAFYHRIPVAHVEAGLRTENRYSPFPEEMNRRLATVLSTLHFAPTSMAKQNLLREGVPEPVIYITGNTVIDALFSIRKRLRAQPDLCDPFGHPDLRKIDFSHPILLVTGHRRENFGDGFLGICQGIEQLAHKYPTLQIVYPVHLNPQVQEPVFRLLAQVPNIYLISPLEYVSFVYLMENSYIILTDSGGIQEEAPALGKPVLVMRDTTERREALEAGTVKLVGTDPAAIVAECSNLLDNPNAYRTMANAHNPYGDGTACQQIAEILLRDEDHDSDHIIS